jgi:surface protein
MKTDVTSLMGLFYDTTNMKSVDFTNFDSSSVTDVSLLFCRSGVSSINFNNFKTANITRCSYMFSECTGISSLNVSKFRLTSTTTDISYMFDGCYNLKTISGINYWDVSGVTNTKSMFSDCTSLTTANISSWNLSSLKYSAGMFRGCGLSSVDLSACGITNLSECNYLFAEMPNLTSVNLTNVKGSPYDVFCMFYDSSKLTTITGFKSLTYTNVDTVSNAQGYASMFRECYALTSVSFLKNIKFGTNASSYERMFYQCKGLTEIDFSTWTLPKPKSLSYMLYECTKLSTVKGLSKLIKTETTNVSYLFSGCSLITNLDFTGCDLSNITNYKYMFQNCKNLTSITMKGNINSSASVTSMFSGVSTTGTFYYDSNYDYSKIIAVLPSTWTAVAI